MMARRGSTGMWLVRAVEWRLISRLTWRLTRHVGTLSLFVLTMIGAVVMWLAEHWHERRGVRNL